jgi:hypothetical protein
MTYKTSNQIIDIVITLLASIAVPKYPKTKPDALQPSEYIVVNTLGVDSELMQVCHVNVNYHVKDITPGTPDNAKIKAGEALVMAILTKVTASSYMIDFEGQHDEREPNQNEHYSNLKFRFLQINN